MNLHEDLRDRSLIISPQVPRIDALAVLEFKEAMRLACLQPADRIVLDLNAVNFIDSSGLGAIVNSMKLFAVGRPFELCGLQPNVSKVFSLTRMDTIFTIHPNLETALAA